LKILHLINDLLLPIVKGYGSEKSWTLLGTESLQTFGGSGFTTDWPLEQYVRDAKIDTLYEGTTAIQGLDFFFRKIVRDRGRSITILGKEIAKFASAGGNLPDEKKALVKNIRRCAGNDRPHGWSGNGVTGESKGALQDRTKYIYVC
jgi:hypothetical protein